jgi:large subunit ribosomal protein L18
MMDAKTRRDARIRRHRRVRTKIAGTADRPRLAVFRSNRHIYAQLIDDDAARTLASASDREISGEGKGDGKGKGKTDPAKEVGGLLAERARAAGIERVVFDRGGRLFHGRVAALAEGAREKGLQI